MSRLSLKDVEGFFFFLAFHSQKSQRFSLERREREGEEGRGRERKRHAAKAHGMESKKKSFST